MNNTEKRVSDKSLNSVYERKCTCCGRVFSAEYRSSDSNSRNKARELTEYRYGIHKLFCNEENYSMLKYSA